MAAQYAEQEIGIVLRPAYEGSNIRSWIGFRHLMYLGQEALLGWLRRQNLGPQRLYQEHGLCLEIVEASFAFIGLVEIDDEITAHVVPGGLNRLRVVLRAHRGDEHVLASKGWFTIALVRRERSRMLPKLPDWLETAIVDDLTQARITPLDARVESLHSPGNPFEWSWRARYFHCHYSDRLQFSAYLRALEEITDRFLEARGLSIPAMLKERSWIPVVSRARVQLLCDAYLDETIDATFAVDDVFKASAYIARMQCNVQRRASKVRTAIAEIVHGYAISEGAAAGQLAQLDAVVVDRLLGRARS